MLLNVHLIVAGMNRVGFNLANIYRLIFHRHPP